VGLGAVRFARVTGRGARPGVVVEPEGPHALAQLLLLQRGRIALRFDLGLALAVGGLGLLEDVDNVLALRGQSVPGGEVSGTGATYTAHHLARPVDNGDRLAHAHCSRGHALPVRCRPRGWCAVQRLTKWSCATCR
jgi:hypothetical protein